MRWLTKPHCGISFVDIIRMSATRIKELIEKFSEVHDAADYAEFMYIASEGKEKEEWGIENDIALNEIYDIYNQIKSLSPSKYMINKYPEIEDILSFL